MNFDDDLNSVPLFDNILANTECIEPPKSHLITPKKSPSKNSRLRDIGVLESKNFKTPVKGESEISNEIKTPRSSLKSYASQTNLNSPSKGNSPAKLLSTYSKLLKDEKSDNVFASPKKGSLTRQSSLTSLDFLGSQSSSSSRSASPSKGGTFMERRQLMLNQKRLKQKANVLPGSNSISIPTTPIKTERVLKKVDFFSTPTDSDVFKKTPKRKIDDSNSFNNIPTPESIRSSALMAQEEEGGSPTKKQKSPTKSMNDSAKQRLIFHDENEEEEQKDLVFDDENIISKEALDHILFKQHMIMKAEFGVGLNASKFDPKVDSPSLVSREEEYRFIIDHLQSKLLKSETFIFDCLVIVGPPGTGKSKQVWQLLQYHYIKEDSEFKSTGDLGMTDGNFKKIHCSLVNCMAYLTVDQVLETVSESISKDTKSLTAFFDIDSFVIFLKKTDLTVVLIMDEMDKFVQKHKTDLHKLIELAKTFKNFIIVSITNSFDIGNISNSFSLNTLLVKPYTIQQISLIINAKLEKVKERIIQSLKEDLPSFNSKQLENINLIQKSGLTMICKKFGTQSGDLRDVTNFIYQILEIRESRALFDTNIDILNHQEKTQVFKHKQKEKGFHIINENKILSEYILHHWSLSPIDFKTIAEVFKLSSDGFNIQNLLNKLNIWQLLVLVVLCRLIDKEQSQQLSNKYISDAHDFKGILYNDLFSMYMRFINSVRKNDSKSCSLLLENQVTNNEFIKIIEVLETNGIVTKYKVKKSYYLLIRYDSQVIYQLLDHSALLQEFITFESDKR